jgi:hypothetical protein
MISDIFRHPLLKVVLVLTLLALPAYLVIRAFDAIYRSAEEANPYPTDPVETITRFFTALQNEKERGPDTPPYQSCYNLLAGQRKAATIIGSHDRESYARHFDRIRNYLVRRIGEDFLSYMEINRSGTTFQVTFDNYITLTVELGATGGLDKKSHYNLKQIRDFPLDIMPGLGVESRNRSVNRAMDSVDGLDMPFIEIEDAADVIDMRQGESPHQHLQRLIDSYHRAIQLDVRHDLLDYIVDNFPHAQIPPRFLQDIIRDSMEAIHLRDMAQQVFDESGTY